MTSAQNNSKLPVAWLVLGLTYTALLIYGTLFPLSGWHPPGAPVAQLLLDSLRATQSRADLLTNLLIYMPFGMMIALLLRHARRPVILVVAAASGFGLSLTLEVTQAFLPGRTPSLFDLGLNTLGALIGAFLPNLFERQHWIGARWSEFRTQLVHPGAASDIALIATGCWALSQLTPFVPSIDIGNLRHGLSPLRQFFNNPAAFDGWRFAGYVATIFGFGAIIAALAVNTRRAFVWYAVFIAAVLFLKIPIISRQLSAEALFGATVALGALFFVRGFPIHRLNALAAVAIVAGVTASALRPDATAALSATSFGWTLFASQMLSINGFQDILEAAAPALALAAIAIHVAPSHASVIAWVGGTALTIAAVTLEYLQLSVPGRVAEISDIVVAVAAWCAAWLLASRRAANARVPGNSKS